MRFLFWVYAGNVAQGLLPLPTITTITNYNQLLPTITIDAQNLFECCAQLNTVCPAAYVQLLISKPKHPLMAPLQRTITPRSHSS